MTMERSLARIKAYQQQAKYPHLLTSAGALYRRVRPGSGLVIVAHEHGALQPAQRSALGEFRLHQYLLWRWFDLSKVCADDLSSDPTLDYTPAPAVHVFAGTGEGTILAYFVMQTACLPQHRGAQAQREEMEPFPAVPEPYLETRGRPQFVAEEGLFGPVFTSLPALRRIPLSAMRELTCLLRNQALPSPVSVTAVIEAILAMTHLSLHSGTLRAILGSVDVEARRVTAILGIPVLYAPLAPVVTVYPSGQERFYWAEREYEPGKFWPFVIAVEDLALYAAHLRRLDEILAGPPGEIRRAIKRLRLEGWRLPPHAFVPPEGASPVLWTADPFWGRSGLPYLA